LEVTQRIGQLRPEGPVIAAPRCATEALERRARNLGITDFLIKDLSFDVLLGAVQRALQEPGMLAGSPTIPAGTVGVPPTLQEKRSILLVDAEQPLRDILTQCLSGHGYRVCRT